LRRSVGLDFKGCLGCDASREKVVTDRENAW